MLFYQVNMSDTSMQKSDIAYDFEEISNWAVGPVSLTLRLAILLNTLEVLENLSNQSGDAQFYFKLNGQVNRQYFEVFEDDEYLSDLNLSADAGFFLPVFQSTGYSPFKNLENFLSKHRETLPDDSFILLAFRQVIDDVLEIAINSETQEQFEARLKELSKRYSNLSLRVKYGHLDIKSMQSEFSCIVGSEISELDESQRKTLSVLFRYAKEFANQLGTRVLYDPNMYLDSRSFETVFDSPNESSVAIKREEHKLWARQFTTSNLSYLFKKEGEVDDIGWPIENWVTFNPQALTP